MSLLPSWGGASCSWPAPSSPPDKERLVGSGCLGWHNVGAGPSGSVHPVTGWDTCANECAFGCMWVRAGVWGCLMLVHKYARWVSGILWVPVQSAAAEMVPGQAPHLLLLSPGAQEDTPTPTPESRDWAGR